jgi:hypothetical protein
MELSDPASQFFQSKKKKKKERKKERESRALTSESKLLWVFFPQTSDSSIVRKQQYS